MAELKYAPDGRLLFTEKMKKEYKILVPNMLPIHFGLAARILRNEGYDLEILMTDGQGIKDQGLRNVHNDTCYPALLVIGQFLDALASGKYDLDKTALLITQTGGGCRASNYIHLLRKALKRSGYDKIPVISLNLSGLEKNPGFSLNLPIIKRLVYALMYGDLLMHLSNQTMPYELNHGDSMRLTEEWQNRLSEEMKQMKNVRYKHVKQQFSEITKAFAAIPISRTNKVRVGIVGEIYIKYSSLGNNGLEHFLFNEGCEVVVPGIIDFIIFKIDNRVEDIDLYGGNGLKRMVCTALENFVKKVQDDLIGIIRDNSDFRTLSRYEDTKKLVKPFLGYGNKMGEGWLLTAEMLELIHSGTNNIVCAQPFGCLPNHVVGKGMIRGIKDTYPQANIVAVDYDPGATRINQENRIKLMLANAVQAKKSVFEENGKFSDKTEKAKSMSESGYTENESLVKGAVR